LFNCDGWKYRLDEQNYLVDTNLGDPTMTQSSRKGDENSRIKSWPGNNRESCGTQRILIAWGQMQWPRILQDSRRPRVTPDDGLKWKDGDTMHWCVLLTEDQRYFKGIGLPGTHAVSKEFKATKLSRGC